MIPILFDPGETAFSSNGLGRLADCISCTVTEERNGIYECQFTYPISGEMYSELREGRIIGVIHDDKKDIQPFDIYGRSAPLDGVVTFYAHHISYRLGNIILRPISASTCAAAITAIPLNTYNPCPFTFWTDKVVTADWTNQTPNPVKAVLGGKTGSLLDVYGKGDYEFDKFNVKLYLNRGNDNGVSIRYGVNLTDLTQDIDASSIYTAVVPYWLGTDGTLITLPEGYIARDDSPIVPVVLNLSSEFQTQPTVSQLRSKATSVLSASGAWLPNENIKVKFVDLSHTEEYKNVAALQRVSLCDKVSVFYSDLDVNAVKMRVVRVVYNVLTEMYDEIELGDAKSTLASTIASQFSDAISNYPTSVQVGSMLETALNNATAQITGAAGGYVRFLYDANGKMQEIVIMDTEDIATAQNVWRWNSGGLGFSSNGYAGPYGTAITQDGQVVASFITSGILNANIVRAGTIASYHGGSSWNLDTGELIISGMSASDLVSNVEASVTGLEIQYAQNQDSAVAPTSGWSTVAPSWAAGWYIWQRTKTTTPDGDYYSDPVCISGRDGSGSTPGLNQATLYLYQRAGAQPEKPSVSMTYTFATGALTNIPTGWSRTIPTGAYPCWVTSAAAISSDTAVTLASNAWQDPVMLATNGVGIELVEDYFAANDSTIPPPTEEFYKLGQLYLWVDDLGNQIVTNAGDSLCFNVTEPPLPTKDRPYVWTFQRTTYTDGTVLDSTKAITAVMGQQGVGVEAIVEEYYLSTSAQRPVGGSWSETQPEWQSGKYLWTRTRVTWTDGEVTTTDPVLAAALNAANEVAAAASAKADTASSREQLIYRSAASGTVTMDAYTTWVSNSANAQNVWTTTRPVYSSTYPVLFVATQRQSVQQRGGTTCSCTTPVIDQTTTVIDGGHISTGTIDAGVVNVTNIKAGNIKSGTLDADRIGSGSITSGKIASGAITASKIDSGAVTAAKIASGAITAAKVDSGAITADKIASGAVTAGKIAAGAITAEKIASGAITADMITTGTMSANRIKGGTLTLGGSGNANGTLVIKNASGATIGTWDKDGIDIKEGSFNIDINSFERIANSSKLAIDERGQFQKEYYSILGTNEYYYNISNCDGVYLIRSYRNFETPSNSELTNSVDYTKIYPGGITLRNTDDSGSIFVVRKSATCQNTISYDKTKIEDGSKLAQIESNKIRVENSSGSVINYSEITHNNIKTTGTKNRVVSTSQYSDRLLYCYETPSPVFGDIGEGVISDDGLCYVWLDPVFAQTICTDQYQVFLQPYGAGDCWVQDRRPGCFVVQGTPGLSFGWEIKAKQRDYDQLRLEKSEDKFTVPTMTYGEDAAQHIEDIKKEREVA